MLYRLRNAWAALTARVDPDYKATHHLEVYFDSDTTMEQIERIRCHIFDMGCVDEVGYFEDE